MNENNTGKFELPKKMEQILASVSKYYAQKNDKTMQELIVNSSYRIQEEWEYDNWDGGTYGHALYLFVPPVLFYKVMDKLEAIQEELNKQIDRLSNVQNENICNVFIEIQEETMNNWRQSSGVFLENTDSVEKVEDHEPSSLWTSGYFRLFICHKAENKKQAVSIKHSLEHYGVSSFVAHQDIEPTKEWQNEIEKALFTMYSLVALMTGSFSDSNWTDQEIGVAIGRKVPVIPVRLGQDPYGFVGKYQALAGGQKNEIQLAREIYDILWQNPRLNQQLTEGLVSEFETSPDYAKANLLMGYVARIERASPNQIDRLVKARRNNRQVREATEVIRKLPGTLKRLKAG